jgi:pyruvate dehydrogenase phosphatase
VDEAWKHSVKDGFRDGEVHLALAGSCALVAVFKDGYIHIANTGDSRAVLGAVNRLGELEVVELTADHNLSNPAEVKLLMAQHEGEKGVISGKDNSKRVKGALKVTRSLGDLYLKDRQFNCLPLPPIFQAKEPFHPPYILNEPQVISRHLEENDRFILIASDGLWENVSTEGQQP